MDASLLSLVSSFLGDGNANPGGVQESQLAASIPEINDPITGITNKIADETEIESYSTPLVHVIVFTKDRPWQLQQLLRSMGELDTDVTIIANVQPEFEQGYQKVKKEFLRINFLEERLDRTFGNLLTTLIHDKRDVDNLNWMFLTDDCILLEPLRVIVGFFASTADICLARLHPGIRWCQTRDIPSPPPTSTQLRYCDESDSFTYLLESGQVEWAYPWDLSGGIYKNALVQEMMTLLDADATSHPNKLEAAGYIQLRKKKKNLTMCFPSSPAVLILTINRVQDVCLTPVEHTIAPLELLTYLYQKRKLDLHAYQACRFSSSHVSELILEEEKISKLDLSVIVPIHNGPPKFARHAMRSITLQLKGQSLIRRMQIILVDDRCTDGSIDAAVSSAATTAKELEWQLAVVDHRHAETLDNGTGGLVIDIYASTKPGIASALNLGLQYANFEFVARMDVDDICTAGRFVRQLRCLERNPNISVLGTHSLLFTEDKSECKTANESKVHHLPYSDINGTWKTRPSFPPTDPGFVAWAMLFSCCLSHPSVMYRKSAIVNTGCYRENVHHAEDYDLWLRLTQNDPLAAASLPFIGLWHRKHAYHEDKINDQRQQAKLCSFRAMHNFVAELDEEIAHYLVNPDSAEKELHLDTAGQALLTLHENFLKTHQKTLSSREVALVVDDCKGRLAEMATVSITKFRNQNSIIWKLWCRHCPEKGLEQIALLCHTQRNAQLY